MNKDDDRTVRRTPAEEPEDWQEIWGATQKANDTEKKVRKLSWYFAVYDNWKALLFGLAIAAFVGGREFAANIVNLLTGGAP